MKRSLKGLLIVSLIFACNHELSLSPQQKASPKSSCSNETSAVSITFAKKYGQPAMSAESVVKTFDGGYVFAGAGDNDITPSIYVGKTNRYGNLLWQYLIDFDDTYASRCHQIRQTTDSGFILIGYGEYPGSIVIKLDKNGNVKWHKIVTDVSNGYSIALASDGGYVGLADFFAGTTRCIVVFKLNSSGNKLWTKKYAYNYGSRGSSIERTSDNGFIIAGSAFKTKSNEDIYLLKIDAQGTTKWQSTFGCGYYDAAFDAVQTSDGGYIAVGRNAKDPYNELSQISLVKFNAKGTYKWNKGYFPSHSGGLYYKVHETSDHGFALTAMPYGKASLIKVGSTGTYQWRKDFPDNVLSYVMDFIIESDGGYVLAGDVYKEISPYIVAALVRTDSRRNY